jgi:3-hydroxyacyl-CoA dehydrogenase
MTREAGVNAALDHGLTVEEADAVAGKVMGFPSTGLFGLFDLVGIDLMPHLAASMSATLPKGDAYLGMIRDYPDHQSDDRDRLYRPQGARVASTG